MSNQTILESTNYMLTYKDDLKDLADSIKNLENSVDEHLQQALLKSSGLVKLSKGIKEINLISQALAEDISDDKSALNKGKLLTSLRHKVFNSQYLLLEEIQKTMLKAAEAMTDAGMGITLMANFNGMLKTLEKFDEKVKDV